jgi:hypothetical protein
MPDQIKIESGLTAGTCYQIEKNVTRIGSGSNSDICLPSSQVPTHAITLERRDDEYRVYNRTKRPFRVGNQAVAAGDAANWLDGVSLVLPDGTSMLMQRNVEAHAGFNSADENAGDDEVDEVEIEDVIDEQPIKPKRKLDPATAKQLLVLAGCIAAMCVFLCDFGGNSTSSSSRFDRIVAAGLASETASAPLLQKLQFAQAALVRNDTEMANYMFSALNSELIEQKPTFVKEDRKVELAILNYVQAQTRRLNANSN